MGAQRTHIVLPESLVKEIDATVGPRGRSAFLVEIARAELRRRKLLALFRSDEPVWQDAAHPGLVEGSGRWVRSLREQSETRDHESTGRVSDPAA